MTLIDKYTKDEIEFIVSQSKSMREVSQKLGYKSYTGDSAKILKQRIKELDISTEHFSLSSKPKLKRSVENIFCIDSTADQSTLRKWYIDKQFSTYICSICGQEPLWNGKKLTLTLDHKNGINNDNRLENLRWVCPNCDRQLDTFGSKNRKNKASKNYCKDCGKEISSKSVHCRECSSKYRVNLYKNKQKESVLYNSDITRETLKGLIRSTSFVKIGEMYNVSDNTIRKWCKIFNLPNKSKIIKSYTDENWKLI